MTQPAIYNGSPAHLANLAAGRAKAATLTAECGFCKQSFVTSGIRQHVAACSQGKSCPVCSSWFSSGGVTCSHACANTYFRTGIQHGNWKASAYRTTCFHFHVKACVICGEAQIVEVHHLDENKKNNTPENLIPLCPTHHQYWHSRLRHLVETKVLEYVQKWKQLTASHASGIIFGS